LVSLSASQRDQGEVLGVEASVQALAQAIPAIISGYVATVGVNAPVLWGGSAMLVGGLLFLGFYHVPKTVRRKEELHEMPAPKL
jgi:DHA1 family tetracycline resistance protein-like MFS transporter